ncbi:hypothetical protein RB653_002469 [Dictyostelium firmibasis]|uniref:Secreted protein n=1 Tax=Dictyostelium firmibasis TaxID=79012 RepID=A0AAN7TXA9_9MYCE
MNKILISFLFSAILFNVFVFSQTTAPTWVDDGTFCFGKTAQTCRSSGACCIWCSNSTAIPPLGDKDTDPGICKYQGDLVNCPTDILDYCPNNGVGYNSGSCTCNLRATSTNSSSATKSINISFITTFVLSLSTILL